MDPRHGGGRENGGGLARGGLSLLLSFSGGEKESKSADKGNYSDSCRPSRQFCCDKISSG